MAILLQPKSQKNLRLLSNAQPDEAKAVEEQITPYNPPQTLHYPLLAFLLDSILIAAAFVIVTNLSNIWISLDNIPAPAIPVILGGVTIVWLVVLGLNQLYQMRDYSNLWSELFTVTKIAILSQIIAMGLLYILGWEMPQKMFVRHFALSVGFMFAWRSLYHTVKYINYNAQKLHRRVLVVSSAERVSSLLTMLRQAQTEYIEVVGVVANPKAVHYSDYLGDLNVDIATLVKRHQIDDVVMAFTHGDKDKAREFFQKVHELPVGAYVLPDYMDVKFSGSPVKRLDDLNLVNVTMPKFNKFDLFLKRAFDIVVASIALFFAAPVMGMVALAIKSESDGPILFIQERMGYGKQRFPIFKFRSMRVGADKELESVSERDEETGRITKPQTSE